MNCFLIHLKFIYNFLDVCLTKIEVCYMLLSIMTYKILLFAKLVINLKCLII